MEIINRIDQNNTELFDSKASLIYFYALGVLGPIVFLLLPVLLGALYVEYGFSESQLGLFATSELAGMATASAFALLWIKRANWRWIVLVSLILIVLGNLLTQRLIGTIDFNLLLLIRFATGLAAGSVMAVFLGFLSEQHDTDKAAGVFVVVQVTVQSIGLYLLPTLLASGSFNNLFTGAKGAFILFALVAAMLTLFISRVPTAAPNKPNDIQSNNTQQNESRLVVSMILGSFILFFITQTAIWSFLELMGSNSGLSQQDALLAISVSTLLSISGPAFAAFHSDRFGRFKPLLAAALMQVISLALLGSLKVNFPLYLILLTFFQAGWNMALAYHFSTLIEADKTHKYIVLIPTAQALGIAIGPLAGGLVIESFSYWGLLVFAAISFLVYCLMILPAARRLDTARDKY